MAKHWYNCIDCEKRIRKSPTNITNIDILCSKCITNRRYRTNTCKVCKLIFTYKKRKKDRIYCSTSCASKDINTGRKCSEKTKEKLSQKAKGGSNGFGCKFYKIWCPYLEKDIKVQGTWELEYAKFLNSNNILWIRDRKINLRYQFINDIKRTYYPDFYLIKSKKYIEIKGAWLFNAKEKMKTVIEQNKNIKIEILQRKELKELGIII